jgi:hypothetical protein
MKAARMLLLFITCCFLATPIAVACSVVRTTPEEKFRRADTVFIGRVVKIEDGFWLEVENSLKNLEKHLVRVIGVGEWNCAGYDDFILGERYLVYAKAIKDPVGAHVALGGTIRLETSGREAAQPPGEQPPPPLESARVAPIPESQGGKGAVWSASIIVAAFAGIGLLANLIKYRAA